MARRRRGEQITGLEREAMREWLRAFIAKADADPKSLTIAELDELARVAALLAPEE